MRNWTDVTDRRDATLIFRDAMMANAQTKKNCCDCPKEAKRQFAILGEFYLEGETLPNQPPKPGNVADIQIPRITEFRVYDTKDTTRNELVVLILPSSRGGMDTEPANILIGAWPAWGTKLQQIAALENQLAVLRQELAADGPS